MEDWGIGIPCPFRDGSISALRCTCCSAAKCGSRKERVKQLWFGCVCFPSDLSPISTVCVTATSSNVFYLGNALFHEPGSLLPFPVHGYWPLGKRESRKGYLLYLLISYPLAWFKALVEISVMDDADFSNLLCSPIPRYKRGHKVWCMNKLHFGLEHTLYISNEPGHVLQTEWHVSVRALCPKPVGCQKLYQMKVFLKGIKFAPLKWSNPTA